MFVKVAWKSGAGALAMRTVSNEDCQTLGATGERQPFLPFRAPEEKPRPSSRNAHIGLHFWYIAHHIII